MHRGNRFEQRQPPVRVGEEIDVTIEAVGTKGDGIAKKNGFVLFIPNVKAGQQLRIRVTKVLQKVGFAEVIGDAAATQESEPTQTEEQPPEESKPEQSEEPKESENYEESENFGEEYDKK